MGMYLIPQVSSTSSLENRLSVMDAAATTNKDARGRRKSSPSANMIYSRKIHNINDPNGVTENEINKLARKMVRARLSGSDAQQLALKEKLVTKCMKFFFITGQNVASRSDGVKHEGDYAQVDGIFIEALIKAADNYDASKGTFTHMLRFVYSRKVQDAAYKAAREDTVFGGGDDSAPISLDASARRNGDGSTTVGDLISFPEYVDDLDSPSEEAKGYDTSIGSYWDDADEQEIVSAVDMLEEAGSLKGYDIESHLENCADAIDDVILLKTISLITSFLGKSGRSANDARKLYTRMFFSETLTRITKIRVEGELEPLSRREKMLFGTVELPFQDSYTIMKCRTILQLWETGFVDIVPDVRRTYNDDPSKNDVDSDYGWTLPGTVFISYLESIGRPASAPLISQQRSHYQKLLQALRS